MISLNREKNTQKARLRICNECSYYLRELQASDNCLEEYERHLRTAHAMLR